ncbi:MAG: glycosyltransferase, partial [Bacteroidetes bacterium]|nr:glycosyltransferase [Bacteroidota bacterium]
YIGACIRSILDQTIPRDYYEIIVSDANSSDNTCAIAKKLADVVVQTSQRGIAHGRNFGAKYAQGEILVFVDSDTILDPEFLNFCEFTFRNERIAGVCGKAIPCDGSLLAKFVYYATYFLVRLFSFFKIHLYPGICVAYRKSVFQLVKGFREDLGISEDIDLSRRISNVGQCKVLPQAKAYVSTRRLQKHCLSVIFFHLWNHCKYLITGKSATYYPKTEEVTNWRDIWKVQN